MIRDLTGSDAAERLRKETLLELGEVVGQLGSWEWLPAKGELFWTDNLYRLFGYAPGEIEPAPDFVFDRLHPDDRKRVQREVDVLSKVGKLSPIEYRILLRDGSSRHLRSMLAVVEERDGRPWRIVGSVRDVTDQRGAEREVSAHVAVAHALARWSSLEEDARRGELLPPSLTPRELEVLQLAAVGKSGPRIAKELFVSPTTVKTHFENIYSKLGVPDRPSAVAVALRLGIIA